MNCFQKLVSLILQTTVTALLPDVAGCELLSKVSIFDITNNGKILKRLEQSVVNCFQKLVSLILQTT